MHIKHACFISYRHTVHDDLIKGVIGALKLELGAQGLTQKPFHDRSNIYVGDLYNPELARAICESACMIVLYTTRHFHKDHTYCTREYIAMKRLEEKRNEVFHKCPQEQHGLIFPLILRGEKRIPNDIKQRWDYLVIDEIDDFDAHAIWKKYKSDFEKIGEKIEHLFSCYEELTDVLIEDCVHHCLPEENDSDVKQILDQASPHHRFPGRRHK